MRLLLFAIAIIWLGNETRATDTRDIQDKVKEGTTVGTEIIRTLGDDTVSKAFGKIGKIAAKIGPFLGAIGPAIALLGLFSDTPELTAIKEGFAKMDTKFDEVFNKFDEVDNLIRETSLKTQYVSYEHTILSLSKYLRRMLNAPNKQLAATYKSLFIQKFTHSNRLATSSVWEGMMGKGIFSTNIPTEAMKFFDNNRKRVQKVIKGAINLILQGVKVELAYETARGNDTLYLGKQKLWKDRISQLVDKAKSYDNEVKHKLQEQMNIDIEKRLKEWKDKSHGDFANNLYHFLLGKYDWRIWYVVSYHELHGSGKHWGHECSGRYHSYRRYGRNLRVASRDPDDYPTFDRNGAGSALTNLKVKNCWSNWWNSGCDLLGAETVYNNLPKKWTDSCANAAAVGVISGNSENIKWKAPWYRMNYYWNAGYMIYIFG